MDMGNRLTAHKALLLASACLVGLALLPMSATAQRRTPAPITFATAGAASNSVTTIDEAATRPVSGQVFRPTGNAEYDREGLATLIASDLAGLPTANGETYNRNMLSAAHPTLPLPSLVHITNTQTGQETVVRVNDRGPIAGGGLIELSDRAANAVGLGADGEGRVRVRYLGPAPAVTKVPEASTASEQPTAPAIVAKEPIAAPLQAIARPEHNVTEAFFVQLGSFSDISNAQRMHSNVDGLTRVKVTAVNVNGNDFFRVLAGPFDSRSSASVVRDQLAYRGVADGVVVSFEN